jgi:hypothetical protein
MIRIRSQERPAYHANQDTVLVNMTASACQPRRAATALTCICAYLFLGLADGDDDDPCLLYLAQSTIPNGKHAPMAVRLLPRHLVRRNILPRIQTVSTGLFVHPHLTLHVASINQTRHKAGLGMFAGKFFGTGELVGRVGDAVFPTVDQDWHNSPDLHSMMKENGDYHWPFTNYDWDAMDIGCGNEAKDISVTVPGFGCEY